MSFSLFKQLFTAAAVAAGLFAAPQAKATVIEAATYSFSNVDFGGLVKLNGVVKTYSGALNPTISFFDLTVTNTSGVGPSSFEFTSSNSTATNNNTSLFFTDATTPFAYLALNFTTAAGDYGVVPLATTSYVCAGSQNCSSNPVFGTNALAISANQKTSVPEPSSMMVLGAGLLALGSIARRARG